MKPSLWLYVTTFAAATFKLSAAVILFWFVFSVSKTMGSALGIAYVLAEASSWFSGKAYEDHMRLAEQQVAERFMKQLTDRNMAPSGIVEDDSYGGHC